MTHTMIWTFGILAFFLLLILVSKISKTPPFWAAADANYKKLAAKSGENEEKIMHRLDQIGLQIGELQTQLTSMERILKEVE
jgi:hypothetical protein